MAIVDDVNQAIVNLITSTVYPNGATNPSALAALGFLGNVYIFPGWPDTQDVNDPDLRPYSEGGDRVADISVADFGTARSTTRFAPKTVVTGIPPATLAWELDGDTAMLSGTPSVPQNLSVTAGNKQYATAVAANDTLSAIVGRLAEQIPGATTNGAALTAPALFAARVGVVATTATEVGRQVSNIRIGIYAGEKAVSMALVRLIKPVLDQQSRLALPDTSVMHILQGEEVAVWPSVKTGVRTRVLIYPVEFPSLVFGTAAQAVTENLVLTTKSAVAAAQG
jgi:hypothetical protein